MSSEKKDTIKPTELTNLATRHWANQQAGAKVAAELERIKALDLRALSEGSWRASAEIFAELGRLHQGAEGIASAIKKVEEANGKVAELEAKLHDSNRTNRAQTQTLKDLEAANKKTAEANAALLQQLSLQFVSSRVSDAAAEVLRTDELFLAKFSSDDEEAAFVVSIDLRRSTELMLKARSAKDFAEFMTGFCTQLEQLVKANFGVFDKFTGDGILAFFPAFYSGPDAGYFALKVAQDAHKLFDDHYRHSRTHFNTVLADVGLGIGIDFGEVRLFKISGGLTVVGEAAVYACRLGGADAKKTLVNQRAYERISELSGLKPQVTETVLKTKHEVIACYEVTGSSSAFTPRLPDWYQSAVGSPRTDQASPESPASYPEAAPRDNAQTASPPPENAPSAPSAESHSGA